MTATADSPQEPSDAAPSPAGPWNAPLAPLSLAAYITWLAVALNPISEVIRGRLRLDDPATLLGLVGLFAQLALFIARARCLNNDSQRIRLLVLAQSVAALVAIRCLPNSDSIAVLLIIVAAQLSAVFTSRAALLWILLNNVFFAGLLMTRGHLISSLPTLFSIIGFQAFAALTTTYARRAENARDALGSINAELLATRRLLLESARGEERLRLSRELHDVAGHKLTALKLQLRMAERDIPEGQRPVLADCVRLADELLADVRGMVDTLRAHDGIDLHAALAALVPSLLRPTVRLELAPEARVPRLDQAQALLRCAQEGLTNALRHSNAANVVLRLSASGQEIELQIEDDGQASALPVFGNGLTGMRERLAGLGGRLVIDLLDAGGLRLRVLLPLHDGSAA